MESVADQIHAPGTHSANLKGNPPMNEILRILAQHLNISEATARKGLGAIMYFLKDYLPANLVAQLQTDVPESNELAAHFEANKESSIMSTVAGAASGLLGGQTGAASKLMSLLGQAGLSTSQVTSFLPKAAELLRDHLPKEVAEKIIELIPSSGETPAQ